MFRRLNAQFHSTQLNNITYPSMKINCTRHVIERAKEKHIVIPKFIEIKSGQVVEAEFQNTTVSKLVVRRSATFSHDLVLVLKPLSNHSWIAITCWLNDKTDTHQTLNIKRIST